MVAAVTLAGAGAVSPSRADVSTTEAESSFIVEGTTAVDAGAEAVDSGAVVDRSLGLVDAVAVKMTKTEAAALSAKSGVTVSPDSKVTLHQVADPAPTTEPALREATGAFAEATGARTLSQTGINGAGVTVAVLDSGIQQLPDFAGRLIGGVDFSGEGNPFSDTYGHGTFVAGLVAGNGASSGGAVVGEAPGANLVSVKVAGASGNTRASKVIAGIQWSIANRAKYNIKVLNLSLGADASESTTTAPLNRAVQKAWAAGITVVVSAGNYGPDNGSISKPGDDPLVITVGASDDHGTTDTADDTIPSFTGVGPTWADGWFKPDLVAPGRSVLSLRVPGSTIDLEHPEGRVGTAGFKGSGTSHSTAIASGAAALVLQAHPTATPDLVKGRLLGSTLPGPAGNPLVDGHGLLSAYGAVKATDIGFSQANVVRWHGDAPAAEDGTVNLADTWAASSWNGGFWNGGQWNGGVWNGGSWNGGVWNGSSWTGGFWNGGTWNGGTWNGGVWNGGSWNGGTWNGGTWNGGTWNGGTWNGGTWNGGVWNGGVWNGGFWNGGTWNGGTWNGGTWNGGLWNGGTWNGGGWNGGVWNGGVWNGGVWNGGVWNGGVWNGGVWNGTGWV